MKSLRRSFAALAALCIASLVLAADPSGTYKWTQQGGGRGRGGQGGQEGQGGQGRGGQPQELTLVLAMKDGKLTGKVTMPGRGGGEPVTAEIKDAKMTGDEIAFSVERQGRNGNSMVTKYAGKLEGDTIKGTMELPAFGGGEARKVDWVAKKSM
jgi:hypothetical protein